MVSRSRLFSKIAKDVDVTGNLTAAAISSDVSFGATVYDSTGVLPYVGNNTGDQAYVKDNNRFYIWDSAGWYNVALINRAPTISSVLDSDGASSPFALSIDGTATTITITATDSDGDPLTYTATADADFNGLATITQDSSVFTITPFSSDSATTESGTITFTATDGVNISSSGVQTFTLEFVSALWDETVLSIGTSSTNSLDNSTFIDRSTNAHTVTTSGSPVQTAFHPYLENWSVEFDGSGDYLQTNSSESLSGDFTIECWVRHIDNGVTANPSQRIFCTTTGGNISANLQLIIGNSTGAGITNGAPYLYTNDFLSISSESITNNGWHHLAVTRSSGDVKLFVNGVQKGNTVTDNTSFSLTNSYIGTRDSGTGNSNFSGNISDLRVVNGTALYTTNFTPPTEKLTAVSGTSLLTCQSNRFIDNSSNAQTITRTGNVKVSAFHPFGQGSEYAVGENKGSVFLDETSSEYLISDLTTLDNVDTTWTVECWAYPTTDGSPEYIIGFNGKDGSNDYIIGVTASFIVGVSSGAQPIIDGQWNHVALTCDGSDVRLFINGVLEETVTYNHAALPLSACVAAVGCEFDASNGGGPGNYFDGYISDWGVSDTCKYTTEFTPPTSPVSADADVLYVPMDNAGIFDKTGNNTLTLVGDASTSTTQTKFADTAMYFDGSGDYISAPFNDYYNFGTNDFTIEFWVNQPTLTSSGDIDVIAHYGIVGGTRWGISFDNRSTNGYPYLRFAVFTNTTQTINVLGAGTSGWSTNTWHHIAVVRSGNDFKLFRDGIQNGSTVTDADAVPSASPSNSSVFTLGSEIGGAPINAYIENFQILKGVAKYTSNFTPPTAEQGRTYQAED